MLKIIPMTKPDEQEKICLTCGLKYDKTQFAYGAYEDDEIAGAAQFSVKEGVGYITDLKCAGEPNFPLIMLLGRAVLNFLDLHGVHDAYFEQRGEIYDRSAALIGFKLKDDRFYANLRGMFTVDHENLPHQAD